MDEISQKSNRTFPPIDKKMMDLLQQYNWPGNIRELRNTVERLLILGFDGKIYKMEALPDAILKRSVTRIKKNGHSKSFGIYTEFANQLFEEFQRDDSLDYKQFILDLERAAIRKAMTSSDHNGLKAAKLLRMSKSTFGFRTRWSSRRWRRRKRYPRCPIISIRSARQIANPSLLRLFSYLGNFPRKESFRWLKLTASIVSIFRND
jgi:transcriptional regulator with PAS, ATPase and Fis domain